MFERVGCRHEIARTIKSDAKVEEISGPQTRLGEKPGIDRRSLCILSQPMERRGKITPHLDTRRVTLEVAPE